MSGISYGDGIAVAEFLPRGKAVRSQGDPRENVSPCRSSLCDSRRRKATGHIKRHPVSGCSFADNFAVAEFLPRGKAVRSQSDPRENVSSCRSPLCGSRRREATGHIKRHPMSGCLPTLTALIWQNFSRAAEPCDRGAIRGRMSRPAARRSAARAGEKPRDTIKRHPISGCLFMVTRGRIELPFQP